MDRKSILIFSLFIISTLSIFAQSGGSFEFIENKGQWEKQVMYRGDLTNGAFFLEKTGFTVLLQNPTELRQIQEYNHATNPDKRIKRPDRYPTSGSASAPSSTGGPAFTLHSHSYNVHFVNPEKDLQIVPDKPLDTYNNYIIGNDPSKWTSHVKIYQALLYKNVYPNIDFRYYSENGKLKYDIIVHPGGDLSRVALKYTGADKLSIKNGELVIKTSVGDVRELSPYSFQFDKIKGRRNVNCRYVITGGNTVSFKVDSYSKDATLIIDPSLIFSSFTGSPANQYGFTATPGPDGSLYSGGIVFGPGFPTTPGALFQTFQGGNGSYPKDIGIMKFSANGSQRVYATYLGGKGNDYPHSLICDPQGNLVVMGRSYSDDYPGKIIGPAKGANIIVTKLNASGTGYTGSLIIGGSGVDGVNISDMQENSANDRANSLIRYYGDDSRSEVVLDGGNNIYVAAQTQSTDFPTSGGFQLKSGGGQDGVVMKIDPSCNNVIWSSCLGGEKNDGAFVLDVNPTNNDVYVAGGTESDNFPGDKSGTVGETFSGMIDGYITIISNDGKTRKKSAFLGTSDIDVIYGIQFDKIGFPYIMGVSRGAWPVVNAAYKIPNTAQFIAKLQPDLSKYLYSTTFGSGKLPNMSPVAFLVDRCENVYISGWGGWIDNNGGGSSDPFKNGGVAGMPHTDDAIKSTTDNKDFYFIVIKKDAAGLLYGTFFGQNGGRYGEHVDGGTSRYDAQGVIYQAMCANCFGGAIFPTTPGVVGPVNGAGIDGCNLAAVKIAFNFAGVAAGPRAYFNGVPDSTGCAPFTVTLRDTIRNAVSYEWQFNDGTPDVKTTNTELDHTFTNVGTYRVRLIAIDSSTCNIRDTAYLNISVRADKAPINFNAVKQPPCQSLSYQFNNLSVAPPGKPFGGLSFTWDFGDGTPRIAAGSGAVVHSFSAAGVYNVRLILTDTSYCNAPDSMQLTLRVSPLVKAQFETPATGCAPYQAAFTNTSLAGKDFLWDFGDGTTSTEVNPVHLYPNTGTYKIKLVATDPETCNKTDETDFTITVSDKPTANFNTTPVPPKENTPTIFHNLSSGGIRYKWLFGDGDSTVTTTMDTVLHQYNSTGAYNACLIVYNASGCTDTACNVVEAHILPLLDVPNAFTPGKFGRNSVIKVAGFGIARMEWKIYNRWGQLVFESHDPKIGWDGTYKGKLQPLDVYAYTLEVEYTNGTKARKTGDITLIK